MTVEEEKFSESHQVGFLKVPVGLGIMPSLSVPRKFMAPAKVDLRDYCTPTEDQGNKPWCAAYAAANWAENILWRKTDAIEQVDPSRIYRYAKSIDGDPNGDGTTLTAVLEALLDFGMFSKTDCRVKVINRNRLSLKYAVHKFGCVLAGFNISSAWWGANRENWFIGTSGQPNRGLHAVIVCGYDKQGVWIQNSWGSGWGEYGFAKMSWEEFDREFMYGAVLTNCLNGLDLNA